jgi:hypothetical protein
VPLAAQRRFRQRGLRLRPATTSMKPDNFRRQALWQRRVGRRFQTQTRHFRSLYPPILRVVDSEEKTASPLVRQSGLVMNFVTTSPWCLARSSFPLPLPELTENGETHNTRNARKKLESRKQHASVQQALVAGRQLGRSYSKFTSRGRARRASRTCMAVHPCIAHQHCREPV